MTLQPNIYDELSEEMQSLVYWSSIYSPADSDIDSIRAAYDAMCLHYTLPRDGTVKIEDKTIANVAHPVNVRLYTPLGSAPATGWPCVLYIHGGGWMVGNLDSHEFITRYLCRDLNVAVLSVDYRLVPEHHFPAAYEDCETVYQWLQQFGTDWNINPAQIVLAGDSAGGNLAAALAVQLQHTGAQACGMALIYPCLSSSFDTAACQQHAEAPLLTLNDMQYYLKEYAPNKSDWQDLRLSPLMAQDFSDMPSSFVAVAEYDPLCDDGRIFVEKLKQANIVAEFYLGKGLLHGSLRLVRDCPVVQDLYQHMLSSIKQMFT
ncbi:MULTISPECIES: alpha/beta hydrolase [unclassified Acinetobacter]|uniref:alpha/beta hydrolase n=1 Tax=unclassified Acinetobacter TaxID=196816 RepID=UPI00190B8FD6|nr:MULTISPECIES: alpha/beta hydrolase [unclassified Acinetobacter]MBK0063621.1 alpha/beta hydrolase [Acinetobacter sp. S55]MBK0067499.1 alpha/beta hydrolase [Acinetobacter sp. S54]